MAAHNQRSQTSRPITSNNPMPRTINIRFDVFYYWLPFRFSVYNCLCISNFHHVRYIPQSFHLTYNIYPSSLRLVTVLCYCLFSSFSLLYPFFTTQFSSHAQEIVFPLSCSAVRLVPQIPSLIMHLRLYFPEITLRHIQTSGFELHFCFT